MQLLSRAFTSGYQLPVGKFCTEACQALRPFVRRISEVNLSVRNTCSVFSRASEKMPVLRIRVWPLPASTNIVRVTVEDPFYWISTAQKNINV